ncbi:DUF397 domain-containing protein [Streptomyces sp. NPDC059743]|uniref:DUF397 domain-containing protein n=1 Tax=Streptomyces sp. NPDC059743 TaxID=3346928 RepID=UPI0036476D7F
MNKLADHYAVDLSDASWRTSSYTAGNGNCVEVAPIPSTSGVAFRDSKNRKIPAGRVSHRAWGNFVTAVVCDTLTTP